MSSSRHSLRIFRKNPTRSLIILGGVHNAETSGQLKPVDEGLYSKTGKLAILFQVTLSDTDPTFFPSTR